ncbi:sporulation protein YabP [Desmospora profundinema]|uniref:Sporulation protein YabP n=1 Tax=Desmospora profundinema TaxID=1571184 RepID=A0ABU1IQM9_9BACL|nr:sporulation protein YabP [Desmospora profundinema]MDR6227098.1 sporulation protein YabP [Desmospora profundinema]
MMEEAYLQGKENHQVVMVGRNTLDVTGVVGVESFDSEEFLLHTECGYLGIRGNNLHIKNLNLEEGRVAIQGEFYEMSYLDDGSTRGEKAKSFLGRLFR